MLPGLLVAITVDDTDIVNAIGRSWRNFYAVFTDRVPISKLVPVIEYDDLGRQIDLMTNFSSKGEARLRGHRRFQAWMDALN